MKDLNKQFERYRTLNNLDTYFTMNLSENTRKRVLENVKTLMTVTDWHDIDK